MEPNLNYFRELWNALCGRGVVVSTAFVDEKTDMQARLNDQAARLAQFEKRSAAGRKAQETRKAKASTGAPQ